MKKETPKKMSKTLKQLGILLAASAALAAVAAPATALAVPEPALMPSTLAVPTNFDPSGEGEHLYEARVANVGAKETDGTPITISTTLPEGIEVAEEEVEPGVFVPKVEFQLRYKDFEELDVAAEPFASFLEVCETTEAAGVQTVTCTVPEELLGSGEESAVLFPGEEWRIAIEVDWTAGTIEEGDVLTSEVAVEGGGAPPAAVTGENGVSATDAPAGFAEFRASLLGEDGQPTTQARTHPNQMVTSFALNLRRKSPGAEGPEFVPSGGDTKDLPVALPPGLVGNPNAAARCSRADFVVTRGDTPFPEESPGIQFQINDCPDSSAVGFITFRRAGGAAGTELVPIYNLEPPPGMPAQLGFKILTFPVYIDTEVRPEDDYRVIAGVRNISEAERVMAGAVTLWGNPSDPRHDPIRGRCLFYRPGLHPLSLDECDATGLAPAPLLRLPSSCGEPLDITGSVDTWARPGQFVSEIVSSPAAEGCDEVPFDPSLEARPTTDVADSPTGLEARLHIPQPQDPAGLGSADLRKTVVELPEGLVINPSGANGLGACSPGQIGIEPSSPSGFDNDRPACPDDSKIGTVRVDTPLIDHTLHGAVFVAEPHDNPFDSLLAIYVTVDDPETGIVVKLAGHVEPDPGTGQLKATFDETPQVPFEDFELDFFGGAAAALRTPQACGGHSTDSTMTPWSAPQGSAVGDSDGWSIDRTPLGGPCPTSESALPNIPAFAAGTLAPIAGADSPFVTHLARADGTQEIKGLNVTLPPGLVARLAGVPYCPDANLGAAAIKDGRAEQAQPSCPAGSRVGSVDVAAGAGPAPYHTQGTAYLTGPYKGAPLSLAVITPAVAGPYDVGTVVVRAALRVDPSTAQVRAISDPLPTILEGIPLDVRSIKIAVDRPAFTLNPTNCDELGVAGEAITAQNQIAPLASRFQVGNCGRLGFKPRISLRLFGGVNRGDYQGLRAVVRPRPGDANIGRTVVRFPRSAFVAQENFRTICTRVQFAADACPKGAIYGRAIAYSPILGYPLRGNVYLRSSNNPLPDLVADLRGPAYQPVRIELVGRTDSVKGVLRSTFDVVPDAPVSYFRLNLLGKRKGLIVNSRNICKGANRAAVAMNAQNGRRALLRPALRNKRCQKAGKAARGQRRAKR